MDDLIGSALRYLMYMHEHIVKQMQLLTGTNPHFKTIYAKVHALDREIAQVIYMLKNQRQMHEREETFIVDFNSDVHRHLNLFGGNLDILHGKEFRSKHHFEQWKTYLRSLSKAESEEIKHDEEILQRLEIIDNHVRAVLKEIREGFVEDDGEIVPHKYRRYRGHRINIGEIADIWEKLLVSFQGILQKDIQIVSEHENTEQGRLKKVQELWHIYEKLDLMAFLKIMKLDDLSQEDKSAFMQAYPDVHDPSADILGRFLAQKYRGKHLEEFIRHLQALSTS